MTDPPSAADEVRNSQPYPIEVRELHSDADWDALANEYPAINPGPVRRCLEVARQDGAVCVVVERGYVDLDYRSEFSAFYSRTFAEYESTATRLHFFGVLLDQSSLWDLPSDPKYVGYVVLRPSQLGRISRSVLIPPPDVTDAVLTRITDKVHFFGRELTVDGVPFSQQDTQLGRCAHSAAWVCHFSAYRRGEVARRPMASFGLSADPSLGEGRPVPSSGLTPRQIQELVRVFDLPCAFYSMRKLPPTAGPAPKAGAPDTRIISICCRYLNSGLPVIIGTPDHAFVLCGYRRARKNGERWITFVRNDDQGGPYMTVENVFEDVTPDGRLMSPWLWIIVPMPDKIWLPAEVAEAAGRRVLKNLAENVLEESPAAEEILALAERNELAMSTYVTSANEFKAGVDGRLPQELVAGYRMARLSRYVWVVEAVDRTKRDRGEPCVLGEAVFDATSSERLPNTLIRHVPGVAQIAVGAKYVTATAPTAPYYSGIARSMSV